ncbi:MAG: hypothetical protein IPK16_29785 [Anaerolineales bacterium]|nr:hypothetical protein [Anaerolineales bacterium]
MTISTANALSLLETVYPNKAELEQVVTKLIDVVRSQYQLRLKHYDQELASMERQYQMDTPTFYRKFEAGELGDRDEYFDWAGLFELREDLLVRMGALDSVS